ncbi:UPF0187-domain-containing protein [Gloeophyllum trabeum ATCC 11539]|uniref:UPF0187-domain-containing protein n=1 Tax=Gloeophyllum trabeum (strain ATCC 11539 / FP-39264 / Madison 617) TaxID=670483 RepID=S7PV27_GLOTA|nr:UPF0187-domain-containing protein [Gloeophyllum trabeum ATCC 11539]EPQ51232.1 UPF0187-domain-containing protein [Gloeophyllum trabeum ATCC 11539]
MVATPAKPPRSPMSAGFDRTQAPALGLRAGMEAAFTHHKVPDAVDPFGARKNPWHSGVDALLATALFRCWHILLFFTGWATAVTLISKYVTSLGIQSTLLTVIGTVLGFVISYRTTSSFERYNEGRRYWSQIVLASRTFARTVWFHVPDTMSYGAGDEHLSEEEKKGRVIVEKKTVINLLEAFSIAVKHYLRGEDGIYYVDLYHLVKFLPSYALPAGLPSTADVREYPEGKDVSDTLSATSPFSSSMSHPNLPEAAKEGNGVSQRLAFSASAPHLPQDTPKKKVNLQVPTSPRSQQAFDVEKGTTHSTGEDFLLPARMPPKYHLFDIFPFSLLVKALTKRGQEVKGKKAARLRARLRRNDTHNLPLEISLYLSSYIAALQQRKAIDPPTSSLLLATLNQLVDALTGLERILTTPIPFSYSIHLWVVTVIYCLALPFQIYTYLGWITIPGTAIASFIFFGFLVAGEEIENPFGYDKNDLNMDHFTHNIIRNELRAITATPAPDPAHWAFSPQNNLVFALSHRWDQEERVAPEEWLKRGLSSMRVALANEV